MENEPIKMPIDGILDLHTFRPKEVKPLLKDYIEACIEKGITDLRIIHGKGTGSHRELVHGQLKKHTEVAHFQLDANWGATTVKLRH